MPFARQPGRTYQPGETVDLGLTTTRYTCPQCDEDIQRLPTGRMRYHGANAVRRRRCTFPETEGEYLTTVTGLHTAMRLWPQFVAVYAAIEPLLVARIVPKKPHGGQIRRKDPTDPNWRWRRK
jgi:hypothetical protein